MHQKRAQVPDQLQSSDGSAVALLKLAGPAGQGAAADHIKVAGREHGHRLPAAHVGADGGVGLGVQIKADHLPTQVREGPAHRSSPREQFQQSWHPRFPCRAGRPTISPQRRRPRSKRAAGGRWRIPRRAAGAEDRPQRAVRLRAVGLPHILVGRVFFGGTKKSAGPTEQRWSSSWARCKPTPEAASSCQSRTTRRGAPKSLQRSCGSHRPKRTLRGTGSTFASRPRRKLLQRWKAGKPLRPRWLPSRRPPCSASL